MDPFDPPERGSCVRLRGGRRARHHEYEGSSCGRDRTDPGAGSGTASRTAAAGSRSCAEPDTVTDSFADSDSDASADAGSRSVPLIRRGAGAARGRHARTLASATAIRGGAFGRAYIRSM